MDITISNLTYVQLYFYSPSVQKLLKVLLAFTFVHPDQTFFHRTFLQYHDFLTRKLDEYFTCLQNVVVLSSRRGGSTEMLPHMEWFDTVDLEPDVISKFLVPLTSLLSCVHGVGFLTYGISQYLHCKKQTHLLWISS